MQNNSQSRLGMLLLLGALIAGLSGCGGLAVQRRPASPKAQLANVFRPPVEGTLTRVAFLPLAGDVQPPDAMAEIERTFFSEFNKSQVFEGVSVSKAQLAEITGQERIRSTDTLPVDFLAQIEERTGAGAVLFTDISHYRPYRPIAIGVRSKLISIRTREVLWSVDATFDSAEPTVAAAAREYGKVTEQSPIQVKAADSAGVLLSPRRFARFVARELYDRLPARSIRVTVTNTAHLYAEASPSSNHGG